jgi:hypothetical protein
MSARAPESKRNFIAILSEATEQRIVEAPPQKSSLESSQESPEESLARSDRPVSRLLVGLMTAMRRRAAKAG